MRDNRTLEIGTGLFVLLGFAALLFLTTQLPASGLKIGTAKKGFAVSAEFDNVGDLKVGSPVTMSGVRVGEVTGISFNAKDYKAKVKMRFDEQYNQIPDDSFAAIQTQGLLGGKYIGLSPGGDDQYLKDGSVIEQTQSAIVLESLLNKFFANYTSKGGDPDGRAAHRHAEQVGVEEMRYATVFASLLLMSAAALAQAPAAPPAAGAAEGPTEVVQAAAQGMLSALDKDRDAYRKDPARVADLVNQYLLPHFDTDFSARLVLGQYWRNATAEQRKRFVDAFYHSLLNNYGSALTDFTADRLKIYPTKVDADAQRATVRTEVKRDNGDRVSVNYYLRKTPEGWKAWDVVIDGISYVNSYREDFAPQIESQGIDAVIKRLDAGEKPEAIGKQTK